LSYSEFAEEASSHSAFEPIHSEAREAAIYRQLQRNFGLGFARRQEHKQVWTMRGVIAFYALRDVNECASHLTRRDVAALMHV
jgi:hypothetical protein